MPLSAFCTARGPGPEEHPSQTQAREKRSAPLRGRLNWIIRMLQIKGLHMFLRNRASFD